MWVEVIKNRVGVSLVTGGEHDYLHVLVGFLKALHQVGTNVDASADDLLSWEVDLQNHVWLLALNIVNAVNQGLVHVKDERLFEVRGRKIYKFCSVNLINGHDFHLSSDEAQC